MNDSGNPYAVSAASPDVELTEQLSADEVIPAGVGARLLNLVIDYVGQILLGLVVGFIGGLIAPEATINFLDNTSDFVFGIILLLSYYLICEGLTGRTLGKLVTGTKVVNEQGGKPSFLQVVGRTFSRLIPFEAFSFLGGPHRGWHDSLPKTYVIKTRR